LRRRWQSSSVRQRRREVSSYRPETKRQWRTHSTSHRLRHALSLFIPCAGHGGSFRSPDACPRNGGCGAAKD
jgi:hypothetical protein